jgi:hypothetical protein
MHEVMKNQKTKLTCPGNALDNAVIVEFNNHASSFDKFSE